MPSTRADRQDGPYLSGNSCEQFTPMSGTGALPVVADPELRPIDLALIPDSDHLVYAPVLRSAWHGKVARRAVAGFDGPDDVIGPRQARGVGAAEPLTREPLAVGSGHAVPQLHRQVEPLVQVLPGLKGLVGRGRCGDHGVVVLERRCHSPASKESAQAKSAENSSEESHMPPSFTIALQVRNQLAALHACPQLHQSQAWRARNHLLLLS